MMRDVFFFLFLTGLANAQSLDRFLPPEAIDDPAKTIRKYRSVQNGISPGQRYFVLGKCHVFLNQEDTALVCFIKARKDFEKRKDTAAVKDIGYEAYRLVSSQEHYDRFGKAYLDEYCAYAERTRSPERLANCYMERAKNAADNDVAPDEAEKLYARALDLVRKSPDPLPKSRLYINVAVVQTDYGRYPAARKLLDESLAFTLATGDRFQLFAHYFNYGNSYLHERKYPEAIRHFEKALAIKIPYYRDKSLRKLYEKLAAAADSINDDGSRRRYAKQFKALDARIKDREQNIAIHALDVKNEVQAKDRHIFFLSSLKQKFERNRILFSILLFLVFALALYSFLRWKKVDRNRKKLESAKQEIEIEHHKTIERLDKISQLVIEDHIVLKNRSKLYLDKLLYIKADDHYLHFVPTEGKASFLRGTLSEILSELPPNFRKCHRSYIVNVNFIRSVNSRGIILTNNEPLPVSRDFRL